MNFPNGKSLNELSEIVHDAGIFIGFKSVSKEVVTTVAEGGAT